jgi:hypothetical protein
LNLDNIFSKLESKADLIGSVAGGLSRGLDSLMANLMALPTHGHIPDLQQTINEFLVLPDIQPTAFMWIVGYIARELGWSKGQVLQKFSEGYLKGLAAQHVLYWSTHSSPGHVPDYSNPNAVRETRSYGGSSGDSPVWRYQS